VYRSSESFSTGAMFSRSSLSDGAGTSSRPTTSESPRRSSEFGRRGRLSLRSRGNDKNVQRYFLYFSGVADTLGRRVNLEVRLSGLYSYHTLSMERFKKCYATCSRFEETPADEVYCASCHYTSPQLCQTTIDIGFWRNTLRERESTRDVVS
jgi:hypothetical protein